MERAYKTYDYFASLLPTLPTFKSIKRPASPIGKYLPSDLITRIATFFDLESLEAASHANRRWRIAVLSIHDFAINFTHIITKRDIDRFTEAPTQSACERDRYFFVSMFNNGGTPSTITCPKKFYPTALQHLSALRSLRVYSGIFYVQKIFFISYLTTLQYLKVEDWYLSDEHLQRLTNLTALHTLYLRSTTITYSGVSVLKHLPLKNLTLHSLMTTSQYKQDMRELMNFKNLKKLTLESCTINHAYVFICLASLENLNIQVCYWDNLDELNLLETHPTLKFNTSLSYCDNSVYNSLNHAIQLIEKATKEYGYRKLFNYRWCFGSSLSHIDVNRTPRA